MHYTTRLTSKGQMTLPRAARDVIGVKPKDQVLVAVTKGEVSITKAPNLEDIWQLTATTKKWPGDRPADQLLARAKKAEHGR